MKHKNKYTEKSNILITKRYCKSATEQEMTKSPNITEPIVKL